METKAIFLDLDGTLLDDEKNITAGNRRAIEEMVEKGHHVIICTGRPIASAILQAQKLGDVFQEGYMICSNGGMIYDFKNQKTVFESRVPNHLVQEVFAEAEKRGLHIQTYGPEHVVVEARCDDENVRTYCGITHMEFDVVQSIAEFTMDPIKMLLSDYKDNSGLKEFQKWLEENYSEELDAFFSCDEYLEIVCKGLSKGFALKKVCEIYGIPVANSVSCGDANNDIPMIADAGIGCAMINGSPEVKEVAKYITERDNNHDAIEEIIRKFILC